MILVTGANGQLGFDVVRELEKRKVKCVGTSKEDLDITDYDCVYKYFDKFKPKCVIHCAAYTKVDMAEEEKELCYKVNIDGTENIAKACKYFNAKMIYISTDYIFDGKGSLPFEENNSANPISVYGKSKYEGEKKIKEILEQYFIVRISWVFGINGNNFVKTMLNLGMKKSDINVVNDQIGSPTYTRDLSVLLCDMTKSEKFGVYHATNEGFCSWAEFASEIMNLGNLSCEIIPIATSEYKSKAVRPLNSRMSKRKLSENGFKLLPHWKDALLRYLKELKNSQYNKKQ